MKPRLKLAWIVVFVLLGLTLATTVAYALYQYFNDPGMQSASEAGLIEELHVTARPTPLPTPTPLATAIQVGEEQMLEGITVSLDWVYLNDARQALGFTVTGLPPELKPGMPGMSFGELVPEQVRGAGLSLQGGPDVVHGTYIIYQIVREPDYDGQTEGHANVRIEIPILDKDGLTLKTFQFDVEQAPIHLEPIPGSNTFATRSMSVEMRLEWVILTPRETRARLCTASLDGQTWDVRTASLRLADTVEEVVNVQPEHNQQVSSVVMENGARCVEVAFPAGSQGAGVMHLSVSQLIGSNGKVLDGTWDFVWAELPGSIQIPGTMEATPATPLATQVAGEMTAILIQAYADANRAAFAVHIEGLPEGHMLYNVALLDANGEEINAGFSATPSETEPGTFSLVFTPVEILPDARFSGQLVLGISPSPGESVTTTFRFELDLPVYQAMILKPGQTVSANGIEMLLDMVKITPSYTQVYLCYQMPTRDDWMIGGSSLLQIGSDQSQMESYSLAFDAEMGSMGKGAEPDWDIPVGYKRCVIVGYPVGHHGRPEAFTLIISELERSLPELIPDDQLQMARQRLQQEGIEMDWVVSFGSSGGGGGPVIRKKPAGMTDEQVMRRFYEVLGYYYRGPWIFMIEVNP